MNNEQMDVGREIILPTFIHLLVRILLDLTLRKISFTKRDVVVENTRDLVSREDEFMNLMNRTRLVVDINKP